MINNKEKNFISVVVYIHNNENIINVFIEKMNRVLEDNFDKFEIICVNDHSEDSSLNEIKKASEVIKAPLSIINMSSYQGIELSMNAGIDLAIGDFVYEFDNIKLDYSIDLVMKVYQHSMEGYDIVSAAPNNIGSPTSKLFYFLFNKYTEANYKFRTESFRILSRRAINRVHAKSKTIPYRKALYANCGLRTDQILYKVNSLNNDIRSSKIRENRKNLAIDALILFTNIAYKFAIALATIMMLVTVVTAAYTLVIFLGHAKPIAGWTTTMLFLSFSFFGVFMLSAIIIKYLTLILKLLFDKMVYTIESVEKINK